MISFDDLRRLNADPRQQYRCCHSINIYDSPHLTTLATQAATCRYLRILAIPSEDTPGASTTTFAIPVCLCEDDYPGWISVAALAHLQPVDTPYQAPVLTAAEIGDRLSQVITYTKTALTHPNYYLWGGTVGPHYDCSGLIQAAFQAAHIWLPRDACLQEPFTQAIALDQLQPGDLIFFGPPERANHVALYLEDGCYIHSSGRAIGRNGIGLDWLLRPQDDPNNGDAISRAYFHQIHAAGRVIKSYQPMGKPMKAIAIESEIQSDVNG